MKLIIIGSTGLLATELIKRAIVDTDIESIVAIARRQTVFPPIPSGKVIKLKSVICENFDNWEEIGKSIDDADACIWNIAPSPAQFQGLDFEESRKICTNNILAGMRCIMKLQEKDIEDEWIDEPRPVRFIYVSCARERDEQVLPAQYHIGLLRNSIEHFVVTYEKASDGLLETCVVRPGRILPTIDESVQDISGNIIPAMEVDSVDDPKVRVDEIAVVLLSLVTRGIKQGIGPITVLHNKDLVDCGRRMLGKRPLLTPFQKRFGYTGDVGI